MTDTIVVHRTFQERVYLSAAGHGRIREVLGACRWLYNRSLEQRRNTYRACGKGMSKFAQMKHLTVLRSAQQWWGDLDLQVARGVLVSGGSCVPSLFSPSPKWRNARIPAVSRRGAIPVLGIGGSKARNGERQ